MADADDAPTVPVNLPDVYDEVSQAFARYERALIDNDVATLDELFCRGPHTIRFGVAENLYGYDAIAAFRAARSPAGLQRTLRNTVITTYGRDFATAMTEFVRESFVRDGRLARIGRQSQTWLRTADGWRVVAAHVSLMEVEP
ncbi:MAG TPA: oxalurate catabolism protein HpxZ [Burkholderiaceae bacterium]|nr:oxalurate catabolism protein HpxZ [Burkholderiaceae bacterium]